MPAAKIQAFEPRERPILTPGRFAKLIVWAAIGIVSLAWAIAFGAVFGAVRGMLVGVWETGVAMTTKTIDDLHHLYEEWVER
jgi:hypothetical protein